MRDPEPSADLAADEHLRPSHRVVGDDGADADGARPERELPARAETAEPGAVLPEDRPPGAQRPNDAVPHVRFHERGVIVRLHRERVDGERERARGLVHDVAVGVLRLAKPQRVAGDHHGLVETGEPFHLLSEARIVEPARNPGEVVVGPHVSLAAPGRGERRAARRGIPPIGPEQEGRDSQIQGEQQRGSTTPRCDLAQGHVSRLLRCQARIREPVGS